MQYLSQGLVEAAKALMLGCVEKSKVSNTTSFDRLTDLNEFGTKRDTGEKVCARVGIRVGSRVGVG